MVTDTENPLSVKAPQSLDIDLSPGEVAAALQHLPGMVFFDTAGNIPSRSHSPVSIIAARPVEILRGDIGDVAQLRKTIDQYQTHTPSIGFPSGGACGWVDYEGAYCFGIYPEMLIYQHDRAQWWQCGNLAQEIGSVRPEPSPPVLGEFTASMSQADYESGVRRIHEYIASGDIYQVNLTQRFSSHVQGGSLFPLYQKLREITPAPLATWMQLGEREILSSSPETFLRMSGRNIETCAPSKAPDHVVIPRPRIERLHGSLSNRPKKMPNSP